MRSSIRSCSALVAFCTMHSSCAPAVPLTTEEPDQIEALVSKAAALIDKRGKIVLKQFRIQNSEWRYRDVYLFVINMQGNVIFDAEFPKTEGTNLLKERDEDGVMFRRDFIDMVQVHGSGWVDYMPYEPGASKPIEKWSYVMAVTIDHTAVLVGARAYVK